MQLKFLTGDVNYKDYGGKWISKKMNNGDFDFWYLVELINMHDATGDEDQPMYYLSLSVVAPSEVPKTEIDKALECYGIPEIDVTNPVMLCEVLHGYGISAELWNGSGNNFKKLWVQVHQELKALGFMFGFAMDRYQNRIGSTGWDFIRGDILAGLSRSEK